MNKGIFVLPFLNLVRASRSSIATKHSDALIHVNQLPLAAFALQLQGEGLRTKPRSLVLLAPMRRASSWVSRLAAARRPGLGFGFSEMS
jgi:hypothetical protein